MHETISFSIVIPTYNRASYIRNTLHSVLSQEVDNFEVIVVDDGSMDETESIVRSIHDTRINYYKKQNEERAAARNFGVKKSKGDYVTFLDSDDMLKDNYLTEALNFIKQTPEADIFHTGYDVVSPDGKPIRPWKKLPNPVNRKLIEGNFLSCLGVFAKRKIFLLHPFNEDRALSGTEDYELWIRLAARYPIFTTPVSTACLVNHATRSVLSIQPEQLLTRIALAKKYIGEDESVRKWCGKGLNTLFAYLDLYAALHLAMSNNKQRAFQLLIMACKNHPMLIMDYRFLVVIKKLIFN